jgi:uncharacterized membrane protein
MTTTTHPLVSAYLDDLARMLADLPPGDRAEVVAGVREHIAAALEDRQRVTDEDVSGVIAEVGTPESVAQEAYDDHSRTAVGAAPARTPVSSRGWVPAVVAILQALGLLLTLLVTLATSVFTTASTTDSSGETVTSTSYTGGAALMGSLAGGVMALPFWVAVALLVAVSVLWRRREKVAQLAFLPGAALLLGGLPEVGGALAGATGIVTGSYLALAVVVLGGGWLLFRLTAAGRRSATS